MLVSSFLSMGYRCRAASCQVLAAVLASCASIACSSDDREEPPAEPKASAQALAEPPAPTPAQALAEEASNKAAPPTWPRPGFTQVSLADASPICVFPSYDEQAKPKLLQEVDAQKLRAKRTLVFGAFSPWCVNEKCDDRPSLQCSVDREGDTLVVRTRYWGDHIVGSSCQETCRPITAGCQSPVLEAGSYTVRYGERTFPLRLPSVLRSPCFGTDLPVEELKARAVAEASR